MKRTKIMSLLLATAMSASLIACGSASGSNSSSNSSSSDNTNSSSSTESSSTESVSKDSGSVGNSEKPLVWFNRQPSNSSTGELDMAALNFNKDTYYVGFDENQGAELQGQMVAIDASPAGTNTDGSTSVVKDATIDIDGTTYTIRELASQEMKNSAGATWDAATAGNAIGTWSASFGDQIDVVVSNNDGMGMSMFNAWAKDNKVPTFGYDANSDAVAAIAEGYGGTISQHADVQAYLTLRVLRNALDGVDVDTGIGTADAAGNKLEEGVDYRYNADERSYYALNIAVTADNYQDFTDSTKVYDKVSKQLDASTSPAKKVWLNIYNASDNFLSSTYQPLLQNYDDLLNLNVDYIGGDGQTESNITNRLGNPGEYDAFAINMVKTDNATSYTSLLQQ